MPLQSFVSLPRTGYLLLVLTALGLAAFVLLVGVWWHETDAELSRGEKFSRAPLFESYFLNDLGIADIDDDGRLDLFTTNHSAQQHFLLNSGNGTFSENMTTQLGLDPVPAFPGLAADTVLPESRTPGLYIFYFRSAIVVRSRVSNDAGGGSGQIRMPWKVAVSNTGQMSVDVHAVSAANGSVRTAINFTAQGNGELMIEPQPAPSDGFPIAVELSGSVDLDTVFVGQNGVHPSRPMFIFKPKDRHGMAWADFNSDGRNDVFVSRGGLRGSSVLAEKEQDEIFLGTSRHFSNNGRPRGIDKGGCPGRRVAWVDVDQDNRLDLYQSCGRSEGRGDKYRNRLYRQDSDGMFVEIAEDIGLAIPGYGAFVWFDVDSDGDPDLLWSARRTFTLFRNQGGHFRGELIDTAAPRPASRLGKLAVADFDADGDLDVFNAARDGNTLLLNHAGTLRQEPVGAYGLPEASHTAAWVDFDNDGVLELAALPQGIYRQVSRGRFQPTGLLKSDVPILINDARAAWFDADSDGILDVVVALRPCWPGRVCAAEERGLALARAWLADLANVRSPSPLFASKRWLVDLYRGRATDNHWIAVDAEGPKGNVQGIGAQVSVRTDSLALASEIGLAESSHFSQGNYRLHFGVGGADRINSIDVRWPDGMLLTIRNQPVNRTITVRYADANQNIAARPGEPGQNKSGSSPFLSNPEKPLSK